jgi:hypothetical protein
VEEERGVLVLEPGRNNETVKMEGRKKGDIDRKRERERETSLMLNISYILQGTHEQ